MTLDEMLHRDEGRAYKAYSDPITKGDPWTIGEGHTGPEVHEGLVWDDAQIDFAKQLDVNAAWQACTDHFSPWFGQLCEPRQAVLVAMAYQMGIGRLQKFVDTLNAVESQHFAHAAESMRQSNWAHQTPKRAIRMAYQMERGVQIGSREVILRGDLVTFLRVGGGRLAPAISCTIRI